MVDVAALLKRQAEWQRSQRAATWEEKVRIAEAILESVRQLHQSGQANVQGSTRGEAGAPSKATHE